jgi:hypothetical protein
LEFCQRLLVQHLPLCFDRYGPSVFVLGPGQVVHINKGRLHAFRKMQPCSLDPNDCHYRQREVVLSDRKGELGENVSLAWDW